MPSATRRYAANRTFEESHGRPMQHRRCASAWEHQPNAATSGARFPKSDASFKLSANIGRPDAFARRLNRPPSKLHVAPGVAPWAILNPLSAPPEKTKAPQMRGFCPIAGAGFEPATFGL